MNISHWIGQDVTWLIHTFQHVTNSAHRHAVVPEHGADLLYIYRTSLFMHMWHDWFTQVYFLSSLPIHTEWYWSSVRIFLWRIKRVQSWTRKNKFFQSWFVMRRNESWMSHDVGMSCGWVVDESSWFVIRRKESWISHDETRSITLERVMDESWWSVMLEWVIDESWHRSTCYKRCPSTRSGTGAWRGPLLYI